MFDYLYDVETHTCVSSLNDVNTPKHCVKITYALRSESFNDKT